MNKRHRYRAVLLLGVVCLLIVGAGGLWLRSERRQEALNRQLIASLEAGNGREALILVNEGADPNTRHDPSPPPPPLQMANYLLRHLPLPTNGSPTAFMGACGRCFWREDASHSDTIVPENTALVQAMLQHGANLQARASNGETPLSCALLNPDILQVLLEHRADVNAKGVADRTDLEEACSLGSFRSANLLLEHGADVNLQHDAGNQIMERCIENSEPHDPICTKTLSLLLDHGADPNLSIDGEETAIQYAQRFERPDLVALLKQAGAKK